MTNDEKITRKIADIAATADQYPGVVIVFNEDVRRVLYMSERGLRLLGTTQAEITALGEAYYPRYFNPDASPENVAKVMELLTRNNPDYQVALFQEVRSGPGGAYELYLSNVRILTQDAAGAPQLIICVATPIERESHITAKVQRLLHENDFLRRQAPTYASLTARERDVLRHLALGHSSAEVAAALCISPQTADTHRRNLKQKLAASSTFDLGEYARAFDLI